MKKLTSISVLLIATLFTTSAFSYNVSQVSSYNQNISLAAPAMDFS
jgi:Mg2+ and Co2+ transporter CorA